MIIHYCQTGIDRDDRPEDANAAETLEKAGKRKRNGKAQKNTVDTGNKQTKQTQRLRGKERNGKNEKLFDVPGTVAKDENHPQPSIRIVNQDKVGESEKSANDRECEQMATNINQNLSTISDSKSYSEIIHRLVLDQMATLFRVSKKIRK